jgi:hypothetical protein
VSNIHLKGRSRPENVFFQAPSLRQPVLVQNSLSPSKRANIPINTGLRTLTSGLRRAGRDPKFFLSPHILRSATSCGRVGGRSSHRVRMESRTCASAPGGGISGLGLFLHHERPHHGRCHTSVSSGPASAGSYSDQCASQDFGAAIASAIASRRGEARARQGFAPLLWRGAGKRAETTPQYALRIAFLQQRRTRRVPPKSRSRGHFRNRLWL